LTAPPYLAARHQPHSEEEPTVPLDDGSISSPVTRQPLTRRRFLVGLALAAGGGRLAVNHGRAGATIYASAADWPVALDYLDYDALRERYTRRAFAAAFGTEEDDWDPALGFAENRAYLAGAYGYYGDLYLRSERFLWAGLARLAGASVIGGLDFLARKPFPNYPDPSVLTSGLVAIAKAVFLDLGWQHELFLDDPNLMSTLGAAHDAARPAHASYESAWRAIATGNPAEVATGNLDLLGIEQYSIIQPFYDQILADPAAGPVLRQTGGSARRIHPYHRNFAEVVPNGDLSDPDQRWSWIAEPGGMWEAWVALPAEERRRLVELPLEDLTAQEWGPVIAEWAPAPA
jgi:hypothetical protein